MPFPAWLIVLVTVVAVFAMVAIMWDLRSLDKQYEVRSWRGTWICFDSILAAGFAITGIVGLFPGNYWVIPALLTAGAFLVDPIFDIGFSAVGKDLKTARQIAPVELITAAALIALVVWKGHIG